MFTWVSGALHLDCDVQPKKIWPFHCIFCPTNISCFTLAVPYFAMNKECIIVTTILFLMNCANLGNFYPLWSTRYGLQSAVINMYMYILCIFLYNKWILQETEGTYCNGVRLALTTGISRSANSNLVTKSGYNNTSSALKILLLAEMMWWNGN